MFARCATPTPGRLIAFTLIVALMACGRESARDAQPQRTETARLTRSPFADSLRVRRNAALAKRPDTLGMRADSARILGSPAARVWVIVMSDFQCKRCRDFARNVLPQFRRDFVDPGLARVAFVNYPQDQNFNARFAATAALCAGTVGRFWPMHDSLFAQQEIWERMPDPRPYLDSLAGSAGVPAAVRSDCMTRNRMLLRLSTDLEQSRESGATEVPAVFVADRRLARDELTYDGLAAAVRKALGEAR